MWRMYGGGRPAIDGLRARAADGREALRLLQQLRPDLVLLDIHLPEVDGIDVLRAIRDGGQTPVIMVTALADDVDKLLALRLGADDYVVKPFNPPEVVARVRAVLRRTQARVDGGRAPIRVGAINIDAQARSERPERWNGRATHSWEPVAEVWLNPERGLEVTMMEKTPKAA